MPSKINVNIPSIQADDWQDIAQRFRLELSKRLPDVAAMTPEEIIYFCTALQNLREFEIDAGAHDAQSRRVAEKMARTFD